MSDECTIPSKFIAKKTASPKQSQVEGAFSFLLFLRLNSVRFAKKGWSSEFDKFCKMVKGMSSSL